MNDKSKLNTRKFLITIGICFAALFLGSLLAFYLIFNQIAKNVSVTFTDRNTTQNFNQNPDSTDKLFMDQQNMFNNINREMAEMTKQAQGLSELNNLTPVNPNNASIRTQDNGKEYKIIFELKAFGNNEKNINVKVNGNRVTISAKAQNKDSNNFNSSSFYQTFSVPGKIDKSKITKDIKGDTLTYIIPKDQSSQQPTIQDKQNLPENNHTDEYNDFRKA